MKASTRDTIISLIVATALVVVFLTIGFYIGYTLNGDQRKEIREEVCETYPDADDYVEFCRPESRRRR